MGEMVFSKVIPRLDKRFEKEDHIHDVNNVNKGVMYVGALTTNLKNQNKTPQNHIWTTKETLNAIWKFKVYSQIVDTWG